MEENELVLGLISPFLSISSSCRSISPFWKWAYRYGGTFISRSSSFKTIRWSQPREGGNWVGTSMTFLSLSTIFGMCGGSYVTSSLLFSAMVCTIATQMPPPLYRRSIIWASHDLTSSLDMVVHIFFFPTSLNSMVMSL